jgi:hypothetical protein
MHSLSLELRPSTPLVFWNNIIDLVTPPPSSGTEPAYTPLVLCNKIIDLLDRSLPLITKLPMHLVIYNKKIDLVRPPPSPGTKTVYAPGPL